jgi:hypothetical protein
LGKATAFRFLRPRFRAALLLLEPVCKSISIRLVCANGQVPFGLKTMLPLLFFRYWQSVLSLALLSSGSPPPPSTKAVAFEFVPFEFVPFEVVRIEA